MHKHRMKVNSAHPPGMRFFASEEERRTVCYTPCAARPLKFTSRLKGPASRQEDGDSGAMLSTRTGPAHALPPFTLQAKAPSAHSTLSQQPS